LKAVTLCFTIKVTSFLLLA